MCAQPDGIRPSQRGLDPELFEGLLVRLSPNRGEAAHLYNRSRTRLVQFFEWERCDAPEDLADEVINRVARRIAEREDIANIAGYFLGVARLVALESRSRQAREGRALAEYARHIGDADRLEDSDERALECLDSCLSRLPSDRREHLLRYYSGQQAARIATRGRLAEALGIGPVALRNRMLRMRQSLENCVKACLAGRPARDDSDTSDTLSTNAASPAARGQRT
jgi:DNA-directed RNA polymerase specialized sigma24 family protein